MNITGGFFNRHGVLCNDMLSLKDVISESDFQSFMSEHENIVSEVIEKGDLREQRSEVLLSDAENSPFNERYLEYIGPEDSQPSETSRHPLELTFLQMPMKAKEVIDSPSQLSRNFIVQKDIPYTPFEKNHFPKSETETLSNQDNEVLLSDAEGSLVSETPISPFESVRLPVQSKDKHMLELKTNTTGKLPSDSMMHLSFNGETSIGSPSVNRESLHHTQLTSPQMGSHPAEMPSDLRETRSLVAGENFLSRRILAPSQENETDFATFRAQIVRPENGMPQDFGLQSDDKGSVFQLDERSSSLAEKTTAFEPSRLVSRSSTDSLVVSNDPIKLSPQNAQALQQHMKQVLSQVDTNQIEMRLDPPELGKLRISVSTQNETTSVQFVVTQPQAKEALEAQLPRLRETLLQDGLTLGDVGVEQESASQHSFDGEWGETEQEALTFEEHIEIERHLSVHRRGGLDFYV